MSLCTAATESSSLMLLTPLFTERALYINLYSPHNTVESTDRVTDTNKRKKKKHANENTKQRLRINLLTTSMKKLNN